MSVQKRRVRRRTRWVVRWLEEGRHRQKTFDDRAAAIAFDAEVKAQLRRRRQLGGFAPQEASDLPLRDYVRRCWRQRGVAWADTTKETWADVLDSWILPLIGDVPLRELSRGRVREFRASMVTEGVRAGKVRRVATSNRANAVMTVLSAFCGYAVEDELIPENPCRDIHRLPHRASKHRAHPPVVLERIRARMGERDALAVSLMYLAGLRPEEVFALEWRHVGERVLLIEQAATGGRIKGTKTGVGATVEIVPPLAADLAAWRRALQPARGEDLVIPSRQGDGVMTLRYWRAKVWHAARVEAGVEQATPYDCRHTFGSLLIHEGRDILEVQRAMRHASARTTLEHYAHEFAEWKGREKVTLVEAVAEARATVAAELADEAGAGATTPGGDADASSVAQKLRAPSGEDEDTGAENPDEKRDGRYWARTSDPQLVELAEGGTEGNGGPRKTSSEAGSDEGDDDGIAPDPGSRLRGSCAPAGPKDRPGTGEERPSAAGPLHGESFEPKAQVAPGATGSPGCGHLSPPALSGGRAAIDDQGTDARRRASSPSPAAPFGRCEDCGEPVTVGLEGTFCEACEVECPCCGEAECFASCAGRREQTEDARRRLAERRTPSTRIATEASRQHARAVWSLSGART